MAKMLKYMIQLENLFYNELQKQYQIKEENSSIDDGIVKLALKTGSATEPPAYVENTGIFTNNGILGVLDKDLNISAVDAKEAKVGALLTGTGQLAINGTGKFDVKGQADLSQMSFMGTQVDLGNTDGLLVIQADELVQPKAEQQKGEYSALTDYTFKTDANGMTGIAQKGYLTFELANNAGLGVEEFALVENENALRDSNKLSTEETALLNAFVGQSKSDLHKSVEQMQNGIALDLAQDAMRNKAVRSAVSGRGTSVNVELKYSF